MSLIEILLYPIHWPMNGLLKLYIAFISSVGISILMLGFTFSLLFYPFQRWARRFEQSLGEKIEFVESEVTTLKKRGFKGEKLFLETEKIYIKNHYHPLEKVGMGVSFLVMLPVLASAFLLFNSSDLLTGVSFLFVNDLSEPDKLLDPVNLLPLVMYAITIVDAKIRFRDNAKSQLTFYIISTLLLFLVHDQSSALILYWTGSNIMAMLIFQVM